MADLFKAWWDDNIGYSQLQTLQLEDSEDIQAVTEYLTKASYYASKQAKRSTPIIWCQHRKVELLPTYDWSGDWKWSHDGIRPPQRLRLIT